MILPGHNKDCSGCTGRGTWDSPATTEEVRTVSSTGGMKGVKPQAHHLLPKAGLDAIAEVFNFGAQKYDDHNWRKGYEWSKSYASTIRHLLAYWDGETFDPESGLPHLAHAGCNIMFLLTFLAEQGEGGQFDDRFVNPSNKS